MARMLKILVTAGLMLWVAGLLDSPAATARGKQRGPREQAPMMLAVGETQVLDGRFIKSPKIENPAIVRLIRHRKKNRWILKAKRRGVTYVSFSHAYSPHRNAKRRVKIKIIVR
jgi:hypothetical protein